MSCVLRISGKDFEVDAFLQKSRLKPTAVWHKGEAPWKSMPDKIHKTSGFNWNVSKKDFDDLKRQIADAIKFLKFNRRKLLKLIKNSGVQNILLHFAIERRDTYMQSDYFPPELLLLAGELGIGIELTQYPIAGKNEIARKITKPQSR